MIYTLAQIKDGTGFDRNARFETVTDYNGWTNYETWLVALHINNEQGWQESVHDALRSAISDDPDPDDEVMGMTPYRAGMIVCRNVEDTVESLLGVDEQPSNPFLTDMLRAAMIRVDWDEIGAAFLADVQEQDS